MCVKWVADWEVAEQDIIAFKAVLRDGTAYKSSVPLHNRDPQQKPGTTGAVLGYRRGRYTEGEEPGIYCFETPAMAQCQHDEAGIVVIQVKIPKGTRIRRGRAVIEDVQGRGLELLTINAMRVKVIRELKEADVKKAFWPRARPVDLNYVGGAGGAPHWSYFVCTATTYTTSTATVMWSSVSE